MHCQQVRAPINLISDICLQVHTLTLEEIMYQFQHTIHELVGGP